MATIRPVLLDILQNLLEEDLKSFQWYLSNGVEGFTHIPRAQLEKADRHDTVDKMVQSYGHNGAVEITQAILKNINQNQLAEELGTKHKEDVTDKNPETLLSATQDGESEALQRTRLMAIQKETYERILIGNSLTGHKKFLEDIYTDLIIVQDESGGVICEHEVMQIEMSSCTDEEVCIKCSDLFKVQHDASRCNRKVLTTGIAGVGKTVSVNKFILDWVKGKETQDLHFIFPLPFRELNLKKDKKFSLIELLNQCFFTSKTALRSLPEDEGKVLFIFDGLDECCFPLCFEGEEEVKDINQRTSVGSLITNLLQKNLLPFALIWVTCRPAAAHLIPRDYIDLVTEVRGFNDEQKKAYFSKYCSEDVAFKIVSHIKKSRSLYIMCQIPVFCWISATVLQPLMAQENNKDIPTTLTGMYLRFLLQQKNVMKKKYHERRSKTIDAEHVILKLGKLAFLNLEQGTLMFYEDDLKKCGIDVSDGTVFSGVCTQIFSEQEGVSERNIFSFVHLSVQESLAALYVHHSHCNKQRNAFIPTDFWNKLTWKVKNLTDLHKYAVDRALQSKNGHLDLFLRFLLGLSLESHQSDLKELLPSLKMKGESVSDTADYIKKKLSEQVLFDKSLNLIHCLSELKDNSLMTEIRNYLNSGDLSTQTLSSTQWSALVFVLLMSEETQEKFELRNYRPSDEGLRKLLPVVKSTRQALLDDCNLNKDSCEALASVFSSDSSLKELDLSNNDLKDSGVELLSDGLKNPHCKLQTLRLVSCNLTVDSCKIFAQNLLLVHSSLKELDLSNNDLQDSGVELLSAGLKSSYCNMEILRLVICNLGEKACENLGLALQSVNSSLKKLDLSNNDLLDSGVKLLSAGLKSLHCQLESLGLSGCMVTDEGCSSLASALKSNPHHLRELDLTYNNPGECGVKLLSDLLEDRHCTLKKLQVEHGGKNKMKTGLKKYACELTLDLNTANTHLSLSEGNRKVEWVEEKQPYPNHPDRFQYYQQVLSVESQSERCYWEVDCSGRGAVVAMTYRKITRKEDNKNCLLGFNNQSWSLSCFNDSYIVWHNYNITTVAAPPSHNRRIGVYLDWMAGTLSFYSISPNTHTLTHLHTLHSTFTEPLYAGFRVGPHSTVCVCKME
ncbi:NACHT, LRR and PYD domains-containing protein 12-like [Pygocentrus nattereri]|uniref:B30.2/SPRY domain-containing protein n=1 Tax=Pygocentrus nattereri TaxID=42514 RepID=A0A3B4DVA5_PYGNA|nr:NACHT, LRR and PYD domains-containing protein 12-like [Pygocentrus nattereri]XP_017538116.1 NACHT, LRR and PYD domains-containing protein 12-like [Pygocentrus nattereri]XP_017538117.1 NACHT, LRR and PYD domains-containing protein 12-like [Pygocentrus nattereri]